MNGSEIFWLSILILLIILPFFNSAINNKPLSSVTKILSTPSDIPTGLIDSLFLILIKRS